MDKNLHDIDKLFRDQIEEHEEMPSEKVWDSIDNNLDKSNVVSIKKKYNNLKKLAVALLLLLLGTIAYQIQTNKYASKTVATNKSKAVENKISDNNEKKIDEYKVVAKDSASINFNNYTTANAASKTDTGIDNTQKTINQNNVAAKNTATTTSPNSNITNSTVNNNDDKSTTLPTEKSNNTQRNNKSKPVFNVIDQTESYGKSSVKKSSKQRTKIKVSNAAAEFFEENDSELYTNAKVDNVNTTNDLAALDRIKAEKNIDGKQNAVQKITLHRISPDAELKNIFAKNKNAKAVKSFRSSITPFFSPQFSSNRIEDDHHDGGPQPRNGREAIKKDEQHQTSSSAGILVDIPIGKKWSVQSGITYSNKNIEIEPKKIFAKLDTDGKVKYRFDCSSGYTYIAPKTGTAPSVGDSINATQSKNTLQYVGIPLALNYNFSFGKFSIIPTVGIASNFLVKQQIETELTQGATKEKQTINTIQGMKSVYFNASTGIAFEYSLSKKVALHIMPSGNFALSSINKDAAVKSYPNAFALLGGIKIKL